MSLRKLEASVPPCKRDHVVETLVHEGGIGHETHVGEFIVCKECENCVVVMVAVSYTHLTLPTILLV